VVRQLLILRHAKSSWDHAGLRDHDRPLNDRGRRDAARIGRLLAEENLLPDAVLVSTACRTQETWERLADAAGCDATPRYMEEIYLASGADLRNLLKAMPEDSSRGLILGHNPSVATLVENLTGKQVSMPTASLVLVEWDGSWPDPEAARFVRQWKPKELSDA